MKNLESLTAPMVCSGYHLVVDSVAHYIRENEYSAMYSTVIKVGEDYFAVSSNDNLLPQMKTYKNILPERWKRSLGVDYTFKDNVYAMIVDNHYYWMEQI